MSRPKAMRSIETPDGLTCVDLFVRADGSYGFEEYRKDPEDPRGWFPVGGFADLRYETMTAAFHAAMSSVAWLGTVANEESEM